MTEQHRTVALERDMPRVRQWIDDAVRHAVNEAARAFNSIRYYCDQMETSIERCRERGEKSLCSACIERERLIKDIRGLLPALPETSERRAESGGEVTDMDNVTRVTRGGEDDRELPGGDGEAAFGGSDTGGGN